MTFAVSRRALLDEGERTAPQHRPHRTTFDGSYFEKKRVQKPPPFEWRTTVLRGKTTTEQEKHVRAPRPRGGP